MSWAGNSDCPVTLSNPRPHSAPVNLVLDSLTLKRYKVILDSGSYLLHYLRDLQNSTHMDFSKIKARILAFKTNFKQSNAAEKKYSASKIKCN